jgi:hypothetical protein
MTCELYTLYCGNCLLCRRRLAERLHIVRSFCRFVLIDNDSSDDVWCLHCGMVRQATVARQEIGFVASYRMTTRGI